MLAGEVILRERVPRALRLIEQRWPTQEERFGWRMLARRLNYRYEDLCQVRRARREPPKRVLLGILKVAEEAGVATEVLDILTEGTRSEHYSQPASPSGRLSPQAWRQRRARTASRY